MWPIRGVSSGKYCLNLSESLTQIHKMAGKYLESINVEINGEKKLFSSSEIDENILYLHHA